MKFNNYTTIHGRVVKAYELPVKEIDDLNKVYEKEKKSLASHPKSLPKEYAKEDHYPTVGDICWFNGQAATFSGHKFQHSPTVGDIFLFPNWLAHGVYPFRTKNEERRSVSFNLQLIKKEGAPQVGNAETARRKEFYNKKK